MSFSRSFRGRCPRLFNSSASRTLTAIPRAAAESYSDRDSTKEAGLDELSDILFRIKRGLAGYVSYLAACEMNQAFSEYVLYEPILRILKARGYDVECEVPCAGLQKTDGKGDFKRIDFVAKNHSVQFAIEVKWAKRRRSMLRKISTSFAGFKNAITRHHPSFA